MTNKRLLLMVRIGDVPPRLEEEWNKWYDTKHISNRLNKPGFLSARRFITIEGEYKYLTLYDLDSLEALTSEAYLKLRDWEASQPPDSFEAITPRLPNCSRGIYEQIYPEQGEYQIPNTEILLAMGHDVPPDKEAEFNAWYNTEHIPAIKRVPGFVTARRFCTTKTQLPPRAGRTSSSPKFVTFYDIENEKVFESEAFLKQRNSPWSSWVRSWYSRRFRIVARRIYPKP
jgi:antibiotic biosynthesis monooxygenase (ABM) superfamily enzyme